MLSDAEIRNAKPREKAYKLADGKGLFLFVSPKGARSWRLKYRFGGIEKVLTFGQYPDVKAGAARERRDEARAWLRDHKDPAVELEKRRNAAIAAAGATLAVAAEAWLQEETPGWSPQYAGAVRSRLEKDILPGLGKMPIGSIDRGMVLRELRKIERRGSIETAKRVRGYIEAIFRRAKGEGLVTATTVMELGEITAALKKTPIGGKQPALTTLPELLELQGDIDRSLSSAQTKLASRLLALTVVRVGVLRAAPWSEFEGIDWDDPDAPAPAAIWRIPAARMKLEVEDKGNEAFGHDVPLAPQAVEVLRALRPISGNRDLVFLGGKSWREPMSDAALSSLYKRVRDGAYKGRMVPHGWRAAFSSIMNERAAKLKHADDRMLVDMMLAHVPKGMSASEWAYNRATYLEPRREVAEAWADMVTAGLPSPWSLIGQAPTWARRGPNARPRPKLAAVA